MKKHQLKNQVKARRHQRVRMKVSGTAARPRLSVYRSLEHIYAQLIDDSSGKTLVSAKDSEIKEKLKTKTDKSLAVGKLVAEKALAQNIKEAVFDKGVCKFHGRVKAVAEGAREQGLKI
jgi:large subunit ribosomal protein L18